MIRISLLCLFLVGCFSSKGQMVERSIVQGELAGNPVALQIDRQQATQSQHSISLPPGLLGAATGGWAGIIAAVVGALGIGGAAAAVRGGAAKSALCAVVRGVENLRNDEDLPAGVRKAIDDAMRQQMGDKEKRVIKKIKS
jgi:hypothetical protein